ncbi:MAG: AGE family epimerase/isomerase [Armatimonadota bacterium]
MNNASFRHLAALYRKTLLEDVIPFWTRHAIDPVDGAINNCIDDSGNVLSRDRYLWSQGRALWTFSALVNRIEARREWLRVAHGIAGYLFAHGRDEQGRWMYRLDGDGNVLERVTSIYVDGFVLNGMAEYYRATGCERAARLVAETVENVLERLNRPGSYGIAPYTLAPGVKTLGIPMIFSFFFWNAGSALRRKDISDAGLRLAHELLPGFYAPEQDVVMEFMRIDGGRVDSPEGRVTIPGHVIEAMWFLISIFEESGDSSRIPECCRLIKRYLELGWDWVYGGIRLALGVDNREPVAWQKPKCKPWWVQVEALVATAFAYLHTREPWCIEWHERVRDYAFSHYPVPTGEWKQWLDRFGNPTASAGLPVKDPFHLPRALIYLIDLFEHRLPTALGESSG